MRLYLDRKRRSLGARVSLVSLSALVVGGASLLACAAIAGLDDPAGAGLGPTAGSKDAAADGQAVDKLPEGIELDSTSATIPGAACGFASSPAKIKITNHRKEAVRFTAAATPGSGFTVENPTDTIPPGETKTVGVKVLSDTPGEQADSILLNFPDEPPASRTKIVTVDAVVAGAKFEFSPSRADFGEVRYQDGATPINIELRNTGTLGAEVSSFTGLAQGVNIDWPGGGPLLVPAGGSVTVRATFAGAAGPDAQPIDRLATPVLQSGKHCGAETPLKMTGKRISTDVGVSPATVDYAIQYCTRTPGPKTFNLSNGATNGTTYTYAVTTVAGSRYTVAPATGTIAPAQSVPLTITSAALGNTLPPGASLQEEDLTVTFNPDPGGGVTRKIRVRMDIRGGVILVTPAKRTLAVPAAGGKDTTQFLVTNNGNIKVRVKYQFSGGVGPFVLENDDEINAKSAVGMDVTFEPPNPGQFSRTIEVVAATPNDPPLCVPANVVTVEGNRPDAPTVPDAGGGDDGGT